MPGGVLVLVEGRTIMGVEPGSVAASADRAVTHLPMSVTAGVDGVEHCSCMTRTGLHTPRKLGERLASAGTWVCPTLGRAPGRAILATAAKATSRAAHACGLAERTGRLRAGLDADLIIVDGDPLRDMAALLNVRAVVSRGREVAFAG